jgi:hypothetical protein
MRSATGSRTCRAFHCSVSQISAGDAMASATSLLQRRGDTPNQSTAAETTESLIITNNSFRNTNPTNHRIELWYQQAADRSDQTERGKKMSYGTNRLRIEATKPREGKKFEGREGIGGRINTLPKRGDR